MTYSFLSHYYYCVDTPCEHNFTDQENELTIGWYANQCMVTEVRNNSIKLSLTGGYEMAALVSGWRKNCFTFKAGSQIKVDKYLLNEAHTFNKFLY